MADAINSFFDAYSRMDFDAMKSHLSPAYTFHDPGFGDLSPERSLGMFHMFTARSETSELKVTVSSPPRPGADSRTWVLEYVCEYKFGRAKREVRNTIASTVQVDAEGKIVRQEDEFDVSAWAWQAGGWMMWIAVVLTRAAVVRWTANKRLLEFMKQQ